MTTYLWKGMELGRKRLMAFWHVYLMFKKCTKRLQKVVKTQQSVQEDDRKSQNSNFCLMMFIEYIKWIMIRKCNKRRWWIQIERDIRWSFWENTKANNEAQQSSESVAFEFKSSQVVNAIFRVFNHQFICKVKLFYLGKFQFIFLWASSFFAEQLSFLWGFRSTKHFFAIDWLLSTHKSTETHFTKYWENIFVINLEFPVDSISHSNRTMSETEHSFCIILLIFNLIFHIFIIELLFRDANVCLSCVKLGKMVISTSNWYCWWNSSEIFALIFHSSLYSSAVLFTRIHSTLFYIHFNLPPFHVCVSADVVDKNFTFPGDCFRKSS